MYICNENNNDKNMISSIPQVTDITPLDALWALYQSQSKRVRKAFLKRIEAQDKAEKYEAQMRALESKLSSDERKKLHQMAYEINARAQEVKHAQKQGKMYNSLTKEAEWWLRSPYKSSYEGETLITREGSVSGLKGTTIVGVRPAMWVNYTASGFSASARINSTPSEKQGLPGTTPTSNAQKTTPTPKTQKASTSKTIMKGKYVLFGQYEQDGDQKNGKEDIEWIVLGVDQNKALLLSVYILNQVPYNSRFQEISWADSSIRQYLNRVFYPDAFNTDERKAILTSVVKNDASQGYKNYHYGDNTKDNVFLLSYKEAAEYLKDIQMKTGTITEYAKRFGKQYNNHTGEADWWLRSPYSSKYTAGVIITRDKTTQGLNVNTSAGLRPAIWVNTSSSEFKTYAKVLDNPVVTATPKPTATPTKTATPKPTATPMKTATPKRTATPSITVTSEPNDSEADDSGGGLSAIFANLFGRTSTATPTPKNTATPKATTSTETLGKNAWICPNCGNTATTNFCVNCGTKKPEVISEETWICPNCGSTEDRNFCGNCGTKKPVIETTSIATALPPVPTKTPRLTPKPTAKPTPTPKPTVRPTPTPKPTLVISKNIELSNVYNWFGKRVEDVGKEVEKLGYIANPDNEKGVFRNVFWEYSSNLFVPKSITLIFNTEGRDVNRITFEYDNDANLFSEIRQSLTEIFGKPSYQEYKEENDGRWKTITYESLTWKGNEFSYAIGFPNKGDGNRGSLRDAEKGYAGFTINIIPSNKEASKNTPKPAITPKPTATPRPVYVEVSIESVDIKTTRYGTKEFYIRLKNNSSVSIDRVDFYVQAYNAYGERIENYGKYIYGFYCEELIKPGKMTPKDYYYTHLMLNEAVKLKIAIVKYHRSDGQTIEVPEYQYAWRTFE